jgi:hypothetical protein
MIRLFRFALVGIALDKKLIASKEEKMVSFFPEYEIKNLSAEKRNYRALISVSSRRTAGFSSGVVCRSCG